MFVCTTVPVGTYILEVLTVSAKKCHVLKENSIIVPVFMKPFSVFWNLWHRRIFLTQKNT